MAKKGGGGLLLLVVVVGVLGFGYYQAKQGSSAAPPESAGTGTEHYVALGDSYTSAPKTGGQSGGPAGCLRSDNNYPHLVAAKLSVPAFKDVSCNGATTANLTGGQRTGNGTNPPQLDALGRDTTLVTLGISGNDVGFLNFAKDCVTAKPDAAPCRDKFTAGGRDELAQRIDAVAGKVGGILERIHSLAPKAKVVLVGYPTILPDGEGCWPSVPFGSGDVTYLRDTLGKLNDMLAEQAKAHQAGFADTAQPSKGHDICTASDTRWVEGLIPTSKANPLHPNAKGEQAMADAVLDVLT